MVWYSAFLLSTLVAFVVADGATISASEIVPAWASDNALQLQVLSSKPSPQYTVVPYTEHLGANQSETARKLINRVGTLIETTPSNYLDVRGSSYIAYLSCDDNDGDSFISPNSMLNTLMGVNLSAIILYSKTSDWCAFENTGPSTYDSILSMVDKDEASQVLSYMNSTTGTDLRATITGNATDTVPGNGSEEDKKKNRSALAMSVLYSITGLITVLFIIIIAMGTIRAHRHPDRYGPRSAFGGRSRQSRAKGLARAVLDTIPIVKFGNQEPAKPDPELEPVSTGAAANADRSAGSMAQNIGDQEDHHPASLAGQETESRTRPLQATLANSDENNELGCSICTDDFKDGEDVRVLPCNHQFHPNCIDPWLINVSGTCPLCRLNLQPEEKAVDDADAQSSTPERDDRLPPPLSLEPDEADSGAHAQRTRLSRLLDINRLRHATREEQLEALRQIRSTRVEGEANRQDGEDDARRGARFAAKLKERFMIRTRAQRETEPSESQRV